VVRVIYDAVGSWESDSRMFDEMRRAGCSVLEFHPIAPWRRRFRLGLVGRRDHRKALIIDRRIAMTGGVNIAEPWASLDEGGAGWRDDMVRIEGSSALEMRDVFMETWNRLSSGPRIRPSRAPEGSAIQVLANHARRNRRAIRRSYLSWIRKAKKYICIANSYFVPDRFLRRALASAVRRGVVVRVLLPGESDVPLVQYASRHLYGWLMRHGISIFELQSTVLHSKSAVIDDCWSTVGTYNLDYLSWRYNLEINVTVEDGSFARAMRSQFERDLSQASAVIPERWAYRSVGERLLERVFFLFRRFL
jgi:cardiolipin synthase